MSRSNPRLSVGVVVLAAFIILGGILPFFSPEDPRAWIRHPRNLPPSAEHLLGTTNLGQDTFWLLAYATQNSLFIGVFVAFFATIIGVFAGLAAGFLGGFPDRVITLVADVFIVVPSLPILILMASPAAGTRLTGSDQHRIDSVQLALARPSNALDRFDDARTAVCQYSAFLRLEYADDSGRGDRPPYLQLGNGELRQYGSGRHRH